MCGPSLFFNTIVDWDEESTSLFVAIVVDVDLLKVN